MIGHIPVRVAEVDAVGIERSAERAAGIARSGWDEHALEAGLGENPRVRDAVERHATAETQIRQAGFPVQRARHVDQRILEHPLDAGGAIGEAPAVGGFEVDRLVRVPRRPNSSTNRDEYDRVGRRVVFEVVHVEGECAVRRAPDQLADLVGHAWAARRRRGP